MSGILTDPSSTGGNGATDTGKYVEYNEFGGVTLGGTTIDSAPAPVFKVIVRDGFAIQATVTGEQGFGFEAGMLADNTIGYSTHLTFDGQTGYVVDGNGGTNTTGFQCNVSTTILKGQNSDGDDVFKINVDGTTQVFTGANYVALTKATALAANRAQKFVDAGGVLPVVPEYVDLTAANAALASGDYWWDTTLKKLRIATA